jgi:hypothetical protein
MSYSSSFKFPPVFLFNGDMEVLTDEDETAQRTQFQGLTSYREIPFSEDGSEVNKSVFEQNDQVIQDRITDQVQQMFLRSLPDLKIIKISFSFNKNQSDANLPGNYIRAVIRYQSISTKQLGTTTLTVPTPGGT